MRTTLRIAIAALLLAAWPAPAAAQLDPLSNAGSCVVSPFAAGATSITVTTGCGATLPTGGFNIAVCNVTDYPENCKNSSDVLDPQYELIRVASRSTDTLDVTGGRNTNTEPIQYGDNNHNTGGKVYKIFLLTAKTFTDINTALGATYLTTSANSILTNENNGLTAGRIPYVAAGPLIADSAKFQWDEANIRLGISAGTAAPSFTFHVQGTTGGVISALDSYATSSVTRFRRGNGDSSAITRVASGDSLGAFQWWGASKDDGSAGATFAASAGTIRMTARQDFTSSARGSQFEIQPVAVGGTTVATALTVASDAVTIASGANLSLAGTGVSILNGSNGKFVFDTSNRQMQWHPGSEARPLMQLEDAIASGGTDRTDTRLTLWGRSGVGAVSNFFTAQLNFGAIDATGANASHGWVADGTYTTAGGFGTNTQMLLYDTGNNLHLLRQVYTDPNRLEVGDYILSKGVQLQILGREMDTEADGGVSALDAEGLYDKNDTNTRTFIHGRLRPTFNFGGSNANTTAHLFDLDSVNTSTTGLTTSSTRQRWLYGGTELGRFTNAGIIALGGTATRSTTDGTNLYRCFNGTAPTGTLTNGADLGCESGELVGTDSGGNKSNLTAAFTSSVQGVVPASGSTSTTKFLTANATFVSPEQSKTISIESPSASENFSGIRFNQAVTITKVVAVLQGSSTPSVTWQVRHGTDRSAAGTDLFTANKTTTSVTTGAEETTTFNDATLAANEFLWIATTAQSGTVTAIHLTIFYTVD